MPGLFALALLPFALVGLLLVLLVPVAWLQTTRVRASAGQLEIARRVLGLGRTTTLQSQEIERIAAEARGAHAGKALDAVRIHRKGRKPTAQATTCARSATPSASRMPCSGPCSVGQRARARCHRLSPPRHGMPSRGDGLERSGRDVPT